MRSMRNAWIYAIVSRRCMERVRRQRLSLEMITCMVGGTEGSTSGVASGRRPAAWASHALTKLPSCSCREQSTFWSKSKCSGAERQTLDEVIPCDTYFLDERHWRPGATQCHTAQSNRDVKSAAVGFLQGMCQSERSQVNMWDLMCFPRLQATSSHFKPLQATSSCFKLHPFTKRWIQLRCCPMGLVQITYLYGKSAIGTECS
jgi:hypothetical protein